MAFCVLLAPAFAQGPVEVGPPSRAVYALEANTTPGMSRESNFVTAAALWGLDHTDVVRAFLHEELTRPAYDVPLPIPVLTAATSVRETAA
ncbi:hypothetical protein [Streptomyces sp. NPDC058441]|uniref:hypothetical protein n=1 Tax=Streptomyces sp. NPDC058441 TaxID=3346502 RepID=UPI0036570F08